METKLDPTTKRWLIIGISGIVVISLLFVIFKIFIFTPPKIKKEIPPKEIATLSPEEVAIQFLLTSQEGEKNEERKFLFPDFSKVEIFRESYLSAIAKSGWIPKRNVGNPPEFKILDKREIGDKAIVKIEEITNRRKGDLFFGFLLPEKIEFEITLKKLNEGWKITKVDSENLISERKIGEKEEIKKDVFLKIIKIGEYPQKQPANKFNKFLVLEVEFENRSSNLETFSSITEWQIFNEKNESYIPIPSVEARTIKQEEQIERNQISQVEIPILPDIKMLPNEIKKVEIYFEVPKDFSVEKIIFQNLYKKIIITLK